MSKLEELEKQRLTAYRRGLSLDEIQRLDLRIKALRHKITESEKSVTYSLEVEGHLIQSNIRSIQFLNAISINKTESFLYINKEGHTLSIYIKPGEGIKRAIEICLEELEDPTLSFDTPEEEEIARQCLPLCLESLNATV